MKKITDNFLSLLQKPHWYDEKYDGRKKEFRGISKTEWREAKEKAFYRRHVRTTAKDYAISPLRKAYNYIQERSKPQNGRYQKVAMYGHTWLYLCSPIYGHADYNKARILPIKGHEKQCEWLIRVSERVANATPRLNNEN